LSDAHRDIGYSVSPKPKTDRGTRWPAEQALPEEWIEYGHEARKKHGLKRINLLLEADKFTSWAVNGKPMKDWKLTWRKWCLRAWDGQLEPEPIASVHVAADPLDVQPSVVKLWAKGIRTRDCGPQTLARAVEKGLLTIEQARRLGY